MCLRKENTTGFCEETHAPTRDRGGGLSYKPHANSGAEKASRPLGRPPRESGLAHTSSSAGGTDGRTPAPAKSQGNRRAPNLPQPGSGTAPGGSRGRRLTSSGHRRRSPLPRPALLPTDPPRRRLPAPPQPTAEGRGLRGSRGARLPPAARARPPRRYPPNRRRRRRSPGRTGRAGIASRAARKGHRQPGRLGGTVR